MNEKILRVVEFNKIVDIIMNHAVTTLAKEYIVSLKPSNDIQDVRDMLNDVDEAMQMIAAKGEPSFHGIHDVRLSLKRLQAGGVLSAGELLHIADMLRGCRDLIDYVRDKNDASKFTRIVPLISKLVPNIRIEEKIFSCILNEDEMFDTATTTLFNIRKQINVAHSSIKEKLNDIVRSQKFQKYLQEPIVTLREGRYVVPVKAEYKNEINGLVHDSSSTGSTLYIEPFPVVEANNNIKQLKLKEKREIEKILENLSSNVITILPQLEQNLQIITKADVAFAKAKFGVEYDCIIPEVNNDGYINIIKGRHPLIDKNTVVPIDFWIGDKFNTLVITGPNTGGKTVTLKTVGLFTLIMEAGIPVPANNGTKLSMFDNVFADIGDEQSIQQNLSTFSSHMVNIVNILENVTGCSLVLFDEIGAGTDPTEGSALAIAVLEHVKNIGARTIATTHYSDLKLYAMQTELVENASCEFDLDSLKPTYKLLVGIPGKSNALDISLRLGLSKEIIDSAKSFISSDIVRFEDIISDIHNKQRLIEEEKTKILINTKHVQDLRGKLEEETRNLDEKKKEIILQAKEEAKDIILSAKSETNEILSKAKKVYESAHESKRLSMLEIEKRQLKEILDKLDIPKGIDGIQVGNYATRQEDLKIGTAVYVKSLDSEGVVISLPDNNEVMVQVGVIKIKSKINNLKIVKKHKKSGVSNKENRIINVSKSRNISPQIDLRGQVLDDAILNIDKYIDDVALSGIKMITVIHGKGTGALRKGIHQYLKSNSHVDSFRLGKYGEGEDGVTIVELK